MCFPPAASFFSACTPNRIDRHRCNACHGAGGFTWQTSETTQFAEINRPQETKFTVRSHQRQSLLLSMFCCITTDFYSSIEVSLVLSVPCCFHNELVPFRVIVIVILLGLTTPLVHKTMLTLTKQAIIWINRWLSVQIRKKRIGQSGGLLQLEKRDGGILDPGVYGLIESVTLYYTHNLSSFDSRVNFYKYGASFLLLDGKFFVTCALN